MFLAILLSSLVLLAWSLIMPKTKVSAPQPIVSAIQPVETVQESAKSTVSEVKNFPTSLITYSSGDLEVIFDEKRAAIREIIFKQYNSSKFSPYLGLGSDDKYSFKLISMSPDTVIFRSLDNNLEIVKRFIISKSNYGIDLEINVQSDASFPTTYKSSVILGAIDFNLRTQEAKMEDFTVFSADKLMHPNPRKENVFKQLKFIGLRDKYFCIILGGLPLESTAFIKNLSPGNPSLSIENKDVIIEAKGKYKEKYRAYLGPQQVKAISLVNPDWSSIVHFGTFDFISQVLLQLLEFFHKIVHNWGWAIIILSIAVYLALFPLTLKQLRSMKEMQALQPRIEELRKLYKDNPQKLNKETMELYKEHKVNPLGGCLPLLLQMPIFFALYQALMRSVVLKGARFFWIRDLSEPDRLFTLPKSLPIIGNEINILPLLMMIGMFIQQKMSSVKSGGTSQEQQKIMLIIFPLMFGFIFYKMPSGLVLYWFVNSMLMLANQLTLSKAK